jgi:hypothetical protein
MLNTSAMLTRTKTRNDLLSHENHINSGADNRSIMYMLFTLISPPRTIISTPSKASGQDFWFLLFWDAIIENIPLCAAIVDANVHVGYSKTYPPSTTKPISKSMTLIKQDLKIKQMYEIRTVDR